MSGTFGSVFGSTWGSTFGYQNTSGGGGTVTDDEEDNPDAELPPPPNYLVCDRTGFKITLTDGLHREWTGYLVRKESLDPRHPQELVRMRPEIHRGSPRPEQTDRYIDEQYPSGVTIDDL